MHDELARSQARLDDVFDEEARLVVRRDEAETRLLESEGRLAAARAQHAEMVEAIRKTREEARAQLQRAGEMLAAVLEAQRQAGELVRGEADLRGGGALPEADGPGSLPGEPASDLDGTN